MVARAGVLYRLFPADLDALKQGYSQGPKCIPLREVLVACKWQRRTVKTASKGERTQSFPGACTLRLGSATISFDTLTNIRW